jgi:hypothetical protein
MDCRVCQLWVPQVPCLVAGRTQREPLPSLACLRGCPKNISLPLTMLTSAFLVIETVSDPLEIHTTTLLSHHHLRGF